jgi:hypothetical protein
MFFFTGFTGWYVNRPCFLVKVKEDQCCYWAVQRAERADRFEWLTVLQVCMAAYTRQRTE